MAFQCISRQIVRHIRPRFEVLQKVIPHRNSSSISSQLVGPASEYTDVEVSNNSEEWKFVERLLQKPLIPKPAVKESYPSGWIPPKNTALSHPYFIERTRNHLAPVYLDITFRGQNKKTLIKKIRGDIWALNEDLCQFLEKNQTAPFKTQVNELNGIVRIRGDHVALVLKWYYEKGF